MTIAGKIGAWLVNTAGAVFNPKAEVTDAMAAAAREFGKRGAEVWLAYHENALWAQRKLDAGLVLTEEALTYMEREITARKMAEEARTKNLETENVELQAAGSNGERQPAGDGQRDESGAAAPVQG
jgi:hypothetical protein